MIEITVNGVSKLVSDLRGLSPGLENDVINQTSQIAYDSAQRGAGRHIKTGALFQSLYNRAITGGRSVGHDPLRAPHALFVVGGTKPHQIKPKNKKALRWVGPNGFVFAKTVNHPGYRGDDYMKEAQDDAVRQLPVIFDQVLRRSL